MTDSIPFNADPSWYPRVLKTLARDYPEISDKVWSTAVEENAAANVAAHAERQSAGSAFPFAAIPATDPRSPHDPHKSPLLAADEGHGYEVLDAEDAAEDDETECEGHLDRASETYHCDGSCNSRA